MISPTFQLDHRFQKRLKGRYERYEVRAGILDDSAHHRPRPKSAGLGTLSGGPVRKKSNKTKGTVAQVGEFVRKSGNNYLRAPIAQTKSQLMRDFLKALGDLVTDRTTSRSKVESTLRAVIREPILRGKYGRNTAKTAKRKGFNRKLIDTGQFFRAIVARVRTRRV